MLERKAVIEARKEFLESLHVKKASVFLDYFNTSFQ